MGLFDLFKADDKKKIEGLVKKVKEAYAQPEVRQEAMEALFKMATPEAYAGALKRFTYVCQSLHWDGVEKKWLQDELARVGHPAVASVKEFIHQEDAVTLAVRSLQRMVDDKEATATLLSALRARSPEDYRRTQAKLELIDCLGETKAFDQVWDAMAPYLEDHSDDVRAKVLEVIENWKYQPAAAAVGKLLGDDTLSARVHRQAAQCLCVLEARLQPAPTLPAAAAEEYTGDGDGQVVRKKR